MKKFMIALLIGIIVTAVFAQNQFKSVETALAQSVVRLHVIANSDSYDDQDLKLKVRDAVISGTKDMFINENDVHTAKRDILKNLDYIKKIAEEEIRKNGYDYNVNVTFGDSEFPTKIYNNVTLPAGTYEALKIVIGSGEGKNWWCVMFPPLCFVEGGVSKMDEKSKQILKNSLTDDEYNLIMTEKEIPVKVKFKVYEMWQSGKIFLGEFVKNFK